MGDTWRVFISHTADLRRRPEGRSFIEAAEDAVTRARHAIVDQEYWTARSAPAAQVCREAVEAADVFVTVLGTRYGSPTREQPELSYTELEFQAAQAAGKPTLVFLVDEAAPDRPVDETHGVRQEAFRQRVDGAGFVRATVASPDRLETLLYQALVELGAKKDSVRVWRAPTRNQVFRGREDSLTLLRAALDGSATVIHALHGMGGIGKTALAIEYAHRHADDYDIVWWIPSEDPATIPTALSELAQSLGLAVASDLTAVAVARLQGHLREVGRWLLCFDNAEAPAALAPYLVQGPGHVLITSRNPDWQGIATSVELDRLSPDESVDLLRARVPALPDDEAVRVADALDHLPIALTQAGAFLATSRLASPKYLELLEGRVADVLARGTAPDCPTSFAASWGMALDRLDEEHPAALQFLTVCGYLAPEPIPFTLFTARPDLLPEPLASQVADPLAFVDLMDVVRRRALARVDTDTLQLHRLVQSLLRHRDREANPAPEPAPEPAPT